MDSNSQDGSRPTVVLVHGAYADGSSWNEVIERLLAEGVQVTAPRTRCAASPSTPPTSPTFSTRSPVRSSRRALLRRCGDHQRRHQRRQRRRPGLRRRLRPGRRRKPGNIESNSRDSVLLPALDALQYPTGEGEETALEFAIKPEGFPKPSPPPPEEQTAVMAATQRPLAEVAFTEPSGVPAWRTCLPGPWSLPATRR